MERINPRFVACETGNKRHKCQLDYGDGVEEFDNVVILGGNTEIPASLPSPIDVDADVSINSMRGFDSCVIFEEGEGNIQGRGLVCHEEVRRGSWDGFANDREEYDKLEAI